MQIHNLADITGDGNTHTVIGVPTNARWVQIIAYSVASAARPIRVGGSQVTATLGLPLFQAGASQFFPVDGGDRYNQYDLLDNINYNAASGDVLSVAYAI